MDLETRKSLLSANSIILFIVLLTLLLTIAIKGSVYIHDMNKDKHGIVLLKAISDQEYSRFIDQDLIDYVSQDFSKLNRNNNKCDMIPSSTIVLKEKKDNSCTIGMKDCHMEIGYFNIKGELIKYYDLKRDNERN